MKDMEYFVSAIIAIFLLGIGVYFIISFNSGTINRNIQNDKSESIDFKTNSTDNKNIKSVLPLTNEDFVIKDKNNYIELGGKFKYLKTNEKITKTRTTNENFAYDIYVFENLKIMIGVDTIGSIDLTTPILQTSRGIRIGDSISKVFEKYGNTNDYDTTNIPICYSYFYNSNSISFFVDKNDKVMIIIFEGV